MYLNIFIDWKRYLNFSFSVFQTNQTFEKTIEPNKTFNEDLKDCGMSISLTNFDLQKEGKFIVETNVKFYLLHIFLI